MTQRKRGRCPYCERRCYIRKATEGAHAGRWVACVHKIRKAAGSKPCPGAGWPILDLD